MRTPLVYCAGFAEPYLTPLGGLLDCHLEHPVDVALVVVDVP